MPCWKGTSPGGSHYFPAFPYTSYHLMSVGDVRDLYAFMKTLPAVQTASRDHDVPFPFSLRRPLGGWKFLFFNESSRSSRIQPNRLSGTGAPIS